MNVTCSNWTNESIYVLFSKVDYLTNKFEELSLFLKTLKEMPGIILLCEVNPKHMCQSYCASEFQIDGYQVLTSSFGMNGSRGLLVYYCDSLSISEFSLPSSFQEYLSFKLVAQGRIINFLLIYRSPTSTSANNELFIQLLWEFISVSGDHIIVGDFNFPEINWLSFSCAGSDSRIENKFLECFKVQIYVAAH